MHISLKICHRYMLLVICLLLCMGTNISVERNVMSAMYSKYPWMQAWGFNHTYCIYRLLETEGVKTLKAMSISFVS